jgi:hypothetical protein
LWKILDDCINIGRYSQIKASFSDGYGGRGINGVFLRYCTENKSDSRQVLIDHSVDPFFKIMDKVLDPK